MKKRFSFTDLFRFLTDRASDRSHDSLDRSARLRVGTTTTLSKGRERTFDAEPQRPPEPDSSSAGGLFVSPADRPLQGRR